MRLKMVNTPGDCPFHGPVVGATTLKDGCAKATPLNTTIAMRNEMRLGPMKKISRHSSWYIICNMAPQLKTGANMGREDVAAGKAKQVKGKVNDVVGAIKGDTSQQLKGK